jgi:hypothetical protein
MKNITNANSDNGRHPEKATTLSDTLRRSNSQFLELQHHMKNQILEKLEFYPSNDAFYNRLRQLAMR